MKEKSLWKACPPKQMFVVASKIRASLWNSTSFLYFSLKIFPFLEREDKRGERGGEGESKEDKKKRPEEKERKKKRRREREQGRESWFSSTCVHTQTSGVIPLMILPPPLVFSLESLAIWLFPPSHWENYFETVSESPRAAQFDGHLIIIATDF